MKTTPAPPVDRSTTTDMRNRLSFIAMLAVGACATGNIENRPLVYGTTTSSTTAQLVPQIADLARAKGFVVVREDDKAGQLVVARPDHASPMLVLVQPDAQRATGRGACFVNASCWTWFTVKPLGEVDHQLVEWKHPPDAADDVARELAAAIAVAAR
jgi:hypothetical protein